MKRTKRWPRRQRTLSPTILSSSMLPRNGGHVVFDPSLQLALDERAR